MPAALESESHALSATFTALADPTRRKIVERLSRGPARVGELVQPFEMSWPAVTKHLRVLERADMVHRHRAGQRRILELNPEPINQAREWIEFHRKCWEGSLDALARYLEQGVTRPSPKPTANSPNRT